MKGISQMRVLPLAAESYGLYPLGMRRVGGVRKVGWRVAASPRVVTAISVFAVGLALTSGEASAAFLVFDHGSYGENAIIRVEMGVGDHVTDCPNGGVEDVPGFTATDFYIVPSGTVQPGQVIGGKRRTVISTATGGFYDEVFAFTVPAPGGLNTGAYDVVFDECQDGIADPGVDLIVDHAFNVLIPTNCCPPLDAAIVEAKAEAEALAYTWQRSAVSIRVLNLLSYISTVLSLRQATLGDLFSIAGSIGSEANPWSLGNVATIADHLTSHYNAIAADPPDPAFLELATLKGRAHDDTSVSEVVEDALGELATEAAAEEAIALALLTTVERYQGAAAAGNGDAALLQAGAVLGYARLLQAQLTRTAGAFGTVRGAVSSASPALASARDAVMNLQQSVAAGIPDWDLQQLRQYGLTDAQIEDGRTALLDFDVAPYTPSAIGDALDEQVAASSNMRTSLEPALANTAAVIEEIRNMGFASRAPVAAAGGPYSGQEGTTIAPDGSGSSDPDGTIVRYAWDLNDDGVFDDATGANPTVFLSIEGNSLVGLEVTDNQGHRGISYAPLTVSDVNRRPVITSASPAAVSLDFEAGLDQPFAVTTSDPEGDPVVVEWSVDGALSGSGGTFTHATTPSDQGFHVVRAVAKDAGPLGGRTERRWFVGLTGQIPGPGEQVRPLGSLTQLGGTAGCVSSPQVSPCAPARFLDFSNNTYGDHIELSPDGRSLYTIGASYPGALTVFQRDPATGMIQQLDGPQGCVADSARGVDCVVDDSIGWSIPSLSLSPDGKTLYAASCCYEGLSTLARDPTTGALTPLAPGSFPAAVAFSGVEVSPDGRSVYAAYASSFIGNPFRDGVATFSRDTGTGLLALLPGTEGCVSSDGSGGNCSSAKGMGPTAIRPYVSPDGPNVYVHDGGQATGVFAAFHRDERTGVLAQLPNEDGCASRYGGSCRLSLGYQTVDLAFSPDGKNLYTAAFGNAGEPNGIVAFARDPASGAAVNLQGKDACVSQGDSRCVEAPLLNGFPTAIVVSPDGRNVYVTSVGAFAGTTGGLAAFTRQAATGVLRPLRGTSGCIAENDQGGRCGVANPVAGGRSIEISPDGATVYVASQSPNFASITVFERQAAPRCLDHVLTVPYEKPVTVPLVCSDPNGNPIRRSIVSTSTHGTLGKIDQGSGTVVYTPAPGFAGADAASFKASDGAADSNVATVRLIVSRPTQDANRPPTAVADSYQTNEDTPLLVPAPGVLGNDSDPDPGDALTAVLVNGPTKGKVALNSDGSFSYTPNADTSGTDRFTYRARDEAEAQSDEVAVTITVNAVNDPPVCSGVVSDIARLWPPDHSLRLVKLSGASDPEGQPVTITVTGVTQDEPLDRLGDGDTAPDAQRTGAPNEVWLRAERSGTGDGRVYRVTFTAEDAFGGTCMGVVKIGVPRSQGGAGSGAVEGSLLVDSFGT